MSPRARSLCRAMHCSVHACHEITLRQAIASASMVGGSWALPSELSQMLRPQVLQVDVFTAHHDRSRCFSETVDGSFPVVVAGSWFPRSIGGKAHALCAYVRCLLVAMHIAWVSWR